MLTATARALDTYKRCSAQYLTSPEVLNWNGSELDSRPAWITQQVQTYKATYEL
jgi:hypothetical protein